MGIHLKCPDYDRDILALPTPPIILNQDHQVAEGVDVVKSLMVTEYDTDYIETMPSCACGRTTGRHNLFCDHKGCPDPRVLSTMDRGFHSDTWLQTPAGIEAFIRPNALHMLLTVFTQEGFSAIEWLCNVRYRFDNELCVTFRLFKALNIKRGYNHFVRNFDDILETLMTSGIFKNNPPRRNDTYRFIRENRDRIFPLYLPLPSKRSIITEASNRTRTAVKSMLTIVDAARALHALVGKDNELSESKKEWHVWKALVMMLEFRVFVDKNIMGKKEGWYRKQITGTRSGPSYRAVITSIAGKHDYNEIHLPWGLSIATYFPMLRGMLIRRGMTPNQSTEYLLKSVSRYDPTVAAMFQEAIVQSGYKGLPQLIGRNPTLNLRSIQALYATKVKKDVADNTISLSIHILRSCNADFDGDQVGGKPILSHADWRKANMLSPESGLADLNMPGEHTNNMALGVPVMATINNMMYGRVA